MSSYNFRNDYNNYRNDPYFFWQNRFVNNYHRPRLMNPYSNKEEKYGNQKSNYYYDRLMEFRKKKEEENKRFEDEIELAKKISLQEAEYKEAIEKSKKIAKEKEKKEKENVKTSFNNLKTNKPIKYEIIYKDIKKNNDSSFNNLKHSKTRKNSNKK